MKHKFEVGAAPASAVFLEGAWRAQVVLLASEARAAAGAAGAD